MEHLWPQTVALAEKLALLSVFFTALGLILKQDRFWAYALESAREVRLNLIYFILSAMLISPLLVPVQNGIVVGIFKFHLDLLHVNDYAALPAAATLLLAVIVSDFVGYWRHRMMHLAWLWPAHAIHHSDRTLTWISLARFHPVNKLISMGFNVAVLVMLGFPPWAIVTNSVIRNLYGYWEHADIPWTYGPLKYVLVSPVMHRWHHVREGAGVGSNFSTIFSVFDLTFGTFHVPDEPVGPLGIPEPGFPTDWVRQTLHPFRIWLRPLIGTGASAPEP